MIVIVYPQFHGIGGIARYLDSFLSNLPPGAPEVMLVTGEAPERHWSRPGVELVQLPMGRHRTGLAAWSWRACRFVTELHRTRPVSVLNLHVPPLIPGLFLPIGIPLVLTAHSTYLGLSGRFEENRHYRNPWGALPVTLKMALERSLVRRADTVITLTEQGRRELERYGRRGRVEVVPNGVDLRQFSCPEPAPEKDIDVAFCGRIELVKGSRPMVEVCKRLVALRPDIRIAIVGFGDDESHVWKELTPLGDRVLLTGKVSFGDMVSYYRRSRVYASASYYEGLPGTCLEAMAMKLPAVVWDREFYRHLVQPGRTGRLVPTGHVEAMADEILRLLRQPELAKTMGENARAIVRDQYDWRNLAVRLLQVFEGVEQRTEPLPQAAA